MRKNITKFLILFAILKRKLNSGALSWASMIPRGANRSVSCSLDCSAFSRRVHVFCQTAIDIFVVVLSLMDIVVVLNNQIENCVWQVLGSETNAIYFAIMLLRHSYQIYLLLRHSYHYYAVPPLVPHLFHHHAVSMIQHRYSCYAIRTTSIPPSCCIYDTA